MIKMCEQFHLANRRCDPVAAGTEATIGTTFNPQHTRTVAWLARRLERALAAEEMSLSEYRLLSVIADAAAGSSDLAGRLSVSKPRITALADRLAARGYIVRTHSDDDRRRVQHALTPEGREALTRADRAASNRMNALLEQLSPTEVAEVDNALELIARALTDTRKSASRT